jgi:hypothetical protein
MRLVCLFLLGSLVGCLSPRKAERQLAKIQDKFPEKVISNCDSQVVRIDTFNLVEYDWIETEAPVQTEYMTDTIKIKFEQSSIKVKKTIQKVEIIKYVEDSASIKELTNQLSKYSTDYKKTYLKAKNYEQYSKVLAVLLALLILALYFVAKKK